MRTGRLLVWIALLGGVLGIAVWLMVRTSELPRTDAKPPPSSFAPNRALKSPLLRPTADPEEAVAAPEIAAPNPFKMQKGQELIELLAGTMTVPTPSAAVIELYLQQHTRSAASLLMVWQATGNLDYLREAATRFPNDPQVQFAVLAGDAFPEDRGKWIALFKQSAPLNPLPNYFAAHEYFRQSQTDQAAAELADALGKQGLDDYTVASFPERQELFVAAGASPMESKGGVFAAALPTLQTYLETMKTLAQEITSAQASFASAGDSASAQRLAQAGVVLGRQLNTGGGGRLTVGQMTGLDIEQSILRQLPPDDTLDWLGESPANRLAELQQQREQMQNLSAAASSALPQLGDAELSQYVDQLIQSGELEAMRWLAARSSTQQ